MSIAVDDIVSGLIQTWSTAFNRLDADTLASLYSHSAFFYGSKSLLYRGRDGVAAYFNALPRWTSPVVRFDVAAVSVRPEVINVAGTASFVVDEGAEQLSVKITWVLVQEDGDWKIASHHVSSQTPLL
jgi:uncharacterized protein (TIGR02246 family)